MKFSRSGFFAVVVVLSSCASASAQSSATVTETVNKRHTLGVLTASPNTGVTADENITFSYVLDTAGAPAPTSESVQFLDGASSIGSVQAISSVAGSNLLPYSQIATANGWTTTGTAPTITPNAVNAPSGSTSTASQIAFPSTTSSSSGVQMSVTGTAYAGLPMTLSVWAESAIPTTLTLALADSPAVAASSSTTCAVTSTWQRCTLTYTLPANAGTGFSATLSSVGVVAAQTVNLWAAQVEQASVAGPFVSTIGTARPTGGQGGSVTFNYSLLSHGSHSITVAYAGDSNFYTSTSNAVSLVISTATPTIALAASPVSPNTYGTSITLTATMAAPSGDPADVPTGTVQFFNGATLLGSGTVSGGGLATLTLVGATALPAGTNSITAVYGGSTEFNTVTSSALSYTVTKIAGTVTVTSSLNPSVYGDSVTLSIGVASLLGVTPTGTVSIMDGVTNLGTLTLNGSGTTSLTIPLFTAGSHPITVTYSGDNNYF